MRPSFFKKQVVVFIFAAGMAASCTKTERAASYVNPFIGTGAHGHTYPGATTPFGMVQLSPDTRRDHWEACGGYYYGDSTLLGFSHTHVTGTGRPDLGDILFRPTTQPYSLELEGTDLYRPVRFSHTNEQARPGYYSVWLPDEQIQVELTATCHVGIHRYTFPPSESSKIMIDLSHRLATNERLTELQLCLSGPDEVVGMRRTGLWVGNQPIYFVARFSRPFDSAAVVSNKVVTELTRDTLRGTNLQALLSFSTLKEEQIVAKVAISTVSIDNARENLLAEAKELSFDRACRNAANEWNRHLGTIELKSVTDDEKRIFYTALYHSMVVPNTISDVNGQFRADNGQVRRLEGGQRRLSSYSIWDTFRAWNPLMTLVDTTLVNEMVSSYLDMYEVRGILPVWELWGCETGSMIGFHAVSVIADAYLRGIRGYDAEKAFEAMKATVDTRSRRNNGYYVDNGFIPVELQKGSTSCALEGAYNDWCVASMARALGHEEDYKKYSERALSYLLNFDPETRFFRGKHVDERWTTPFQPLEIGKAYTEATAWQYRFFVPHDVKGLMQLMGGREAFAGALDELFVTHPDPELRSEDITGSVGQYAHGNEPSHHVAYLYNYVGQPWKTQERTRRILREMYHNTPEGIVGNEDCGQMSAWYILSSLGIYPVCPGTGEFAVTTPLFDANVRLANGKVLEIRSNDLSKPYIDRLLFNGKAIESNFLTYDQLMEGGKLEFALTDSPNTHRGTNPGDVPYSYSVSQPEIVTAPYVRNQTDLYLYGNAAQVELICDTPGARIHYTLDGTEPTDRSALYEAPLELSTSVTLRMKAYKKECRPSVVTTLRAEKTALLPPTALRSTRQGVHYAYYEGAFSTTADLLKAEPKETGCLPHPSIEGARRKEEFGYLFSGYLNIPQDGVYEFCTRTDEGSVLFVDNRQVVDNDGGHETISASGRIGLAKGLHPFQLLYFESDEAESFQWSWKPPSSDKFVPLEDSLLCIEK